MMKILFLFFENHVLPDQDHAEPLHKVIAQEHVAVEDPAEEPSRRRQARQQNARLEETAAVTAGT